MQAELIWKNNNSVLKNTLNEIGRRMMCCTRRHLEKWLYLSSKVYCGPWFTTFDRKWIVFFLKKPSSEINVLPAVTRNMMQPSAMITVL